MGLLDNLTDEQRGGLLAMGAAMMQPTRTGRFGESLSNGLMTYGSSIKDQQDRVMRKRMQELQMGNLQAQADLHTQQAALAKQKAAQEAQEREFLNSIANRSPQMRAGSMAMGQGASQGSIGPTVDNAQRQTQILAQTPQQGGGLLAQMTPDDIATLTMINSSKAGPLFEQYKWAMDPQKLEGGSTYRNRLTGEERSIPKLGDGMVLNNGVVSNVPGYVQSNAQTKGAETMATEGGKQLMQYGFGRGQYIDGKGQTREDFLANINGTPPALSLGWLNGLLGVPQAPQAQPMPQSAPQGIPQPTMPARPSAAPSAPPKGRTDPNFPRADASWNNDRIPLIQSELQAARARGDTKAITYLERELAAIPASNAALEGGRTMAPGAATQSSGPMPGGPVVKLSQTGQASDLAMNEDWIKNSYRPVIDSGTLAADTKANIAALRNVNLNTGFGTETKGQAAAILAGLGIAPKNAEMYASNVQIFQSQAMAQLVKVFEGQKGTQTEGDAKRVQQTWASIKNTPAANQFILDMAEAKANRDQEKAAFYQNAQDYARKNGLSLADIDREWAKQARSVWSDPLLAKWLPQQGGQTFKRDPRGSSGSW